MTDRTRYVVMGATGHVGSAVALALLDAHLPVTVVMRDEKAVARWESAGARVALIDVQDSDALREAFRTGDRAFLLNPPAPTDTDTDHEEHRTLERIVAALDDSGLDKVVLESTYGAQAGERIGDLSVLYDFEQALGRQPIPATMLRAAYYMSNWDAMLDAARQGALPTMFPADLEIPMVAPADIGGAAARLLQEPVGKTGIRYIEGPAKYTPQDAADAFAGALGHKVELAVTPRDQWVGAYRELGFSCEAAEAFARMTAASIDQGPDIPADPERGTTTLQAYIATLTARGDG